MKLNITAGVKAFLLFVLFCLPASRSGAVDLLPFVTRDQGPLASLYGLPPALEGGTVQEGRSVGYGTLQIVSHNSGSDKEDEVLRFDGETYRLTLGYRYGIRNGIEVGMALPVVLHRGGFLDGFIIDWHNFFHLPQGGRDQAPTDQLLFTYLDHGEEELYLSDNTGGLGDLRLSAAWPLLKDPEKERAMALRLTLKLPTGDSGKLLGSGSTDLALWLSADQQWRLPQGKFALFGSAGVLAMSEGDLLPQRQRNVVGFGTLGAGWAPWESVGFKIQVDGHSALYDSDLRQLGPSAQLTLGGSVAVTPQTTLDLGVSEDLAVDTAPDVVFHFGLRHAF